MRQLRERRLDVAKNHPGRSLGAELERVRLERRVAQLEVVIARLNQRVRATDAGHDERAGLKRAIGDFHTELEQMRTRLAEIAEPLLPGAQVEPATSD